MTCLAVLAVLSIIGAFLGSASARSMFNSAPVGFYWLASAVLLAWTVGLLAWAGRSWDTLAIHLGPILVLVGGLWGSQAGHQLQHWLFGCQKVARAQMWIPEQAATDVAFIDGQMDAQVTIPFSIRLDRFELQHYEPGYLLIRQGRGPQTRIPALPGMVHPLEGRRMHVEIMRVFQNLQVRSGPDGTVAVDDPNAPANPALYVRLTQADGRQKDYYVFEPGQMGHDHAPGLAYIRPIKDYLSHIQLIDEGRVVKEATIEVNKPLHYGGYYFLQSGYQLAPDGTAWTILAVVSDSGLRLVFAGYGLLWVGLTWRLWVKRFAGSGQVRTGEGVGQCT